MTYEDAYPRSHATPGWFYDDELKGLWTCCEAASQGNAIVEVGAYKGKTSSLLAQFAQDRHVPFHTIEPFWLNEFITADGQHGNNHHYVDKVFQKEIHDDFVKNMAGLPYNLHLGTCADPPETEFSLPSVIDFVFFDGDHTYGGLPIDCARLLPRVRSGGLAAFHDYRADIYEVIPIVNWECRDWTLFGDFGYSLHVMRKP